MYVSQAYWRMYASLGLDGFYYVPYRIHVYRVEFISGNMIYIYIYIYFQFPLFLTIEMEYVVAIRLKAIALTHFNKNMTI